MEKTYSINLAGLVFQIEEQAYEVLKKYLETLQERFRDEAERKEIMADIEARIAEMFDERMHDRKQVVLLMDVEAVISTLGDPEQIVEESETGEEDHSGSSEGSRGFGFGKRLFRDPDDKILGGVLSGISAYFGIGDPIWLRLLVVTLVLLSVGSLIPIYIILWFIIPKAETTSEKLLMRGKPVTVDNIQKKVREEFEDVKKNIHGQNSSATRGGRQMIHGLLEIIRYIVVFALKLFAAVFLLVALCLMIAFFIVQAALIIPHFATLAALIFGSKLALVFVNVAFFLLIAIPIFYLTYLGLRNKVSSDSHVKRIGLAVGSVWFIALFTLGFIGIMTAVDFSADYSDEEIIEIEQPYNDTLYLSTMDHGKRTKQIFNDGGVVNINGDVDVYLDDNGFYLPGKISIEKSPNNKFELVAIKYSNGKSSADAMKLADAIDFKMEQNGNELSLPEIFSFPRDNRWRDQSVEFVLRVPEDKAVVYDKHVREMLEELKRQEQFTKTEGVGQVLVMDKRGFVCEGCEKSDAKTMAYEGDSDYEILELNGSFEGTITQGPGFGVEFENEDDEDEVKIKKSGNEITISTKKRWFFAKNVKLDIIVPELKEIEFNGAADFDLQEFQTDALSLDASGAAELNLDEVNIGELKIDVSGASEITASGVAEDVSIDCSGASEIKAKELRTQRMNIDASGAIEAKVTVEENFTADVSGAADIVYYGDPLVKIEKSGAADIRNGDD